MADDIRKVYGDARFVLRKDTLENWQTENPVLLEGEPSYVTDGEDNKKIKLGDGITPWNDLAYFSSGTDVEVDQNYNPESENAQSGKAVAEAIRSSVYYHTEREEIGVQHEDINTDYVVGLYDALMAEYPDNVEKISIQSDDGKFTNYVYEISTGEYCPTVKTVYGTQFSADEHIKKPKYLVLNAFHGNERKTVFSTYRFIRDVLKGHNVPKHFKEGAIIQVMPVANPTGFNAFEYRKPSGVDINHNFDWNWEEGKSSGDYPASEPETQVITKWLTDNIDADLFIDFHNNGMVNENVAIIGTPNNDDTERVKEIALRGINRVIPFWRDIIGYDSFVVPVMGETSITDEREEKDVIFAYSVSGEIGGSAFNYAQNVLDIPSFVMETSSYYGDYDEWEANETTYPAETIAMGAEALGNILIEYFSETSEVIDMSDVNDKLDTILQGVSFREVKGKLVVNATTGADIIYANGTVDVATGDLIPVEGKSSLRIKLPIPNGAKIVCIKADAETEAAIKKTQTKYFIQATVDFGHIGYFVIENLYSHILWGYDNSSSKWNYTLGNSQCYNTDGFNIGLPNLKAGTYDWVAYYWND
ncbi:MAG: succinylglutamate desuccinylase/aspartoacylase family protein [Clostridia bacterium]|nr:succinylglutamate desuccinylase/aspartoacylase family protein [Clostridia bacterium]